MLWIVTGAAGFLGNTIVRQLLQEGHEVRACVMEKDVPRSLQGLECEVVQLDVRDPESVMRALTAPSSARVIHAAGVVSIEGAVSPQVREVNVDGTANVVAACKELGIERLVYVSSVHAIPEPTSDAPITEPLTPADVNPDLVVGEYAKTKAEATRIVMEATDLDAVIVHPSGISGPGDYGDTHLTALVAQVAAGKLPFIVDGGYDFVDVRDVAAATIQAGHREGASGCYILSGTYLTIHELVDLIGPPRKPHRMPTWVAKAIVPFAGWHYRLWNLVPQFTAYSLYTLEAKSSFSNTKARDELGFNPRPIAETVKDTLAFVRES